MTNEKRGKGPGITFLRMGDTNRQAGLISRGCKSLQKIANFCKNLQKNGHFLQIISKYFKKIQYFLAPFRPVFDVFSFILAVLFSFGFRKKIFFRKFADPQKTQYLQGFLAFLTSLKKGRKNPNITNITNIFKNAHSPALVLGYVLKYRQRSKCL